MPYTILGLLVFTLYLYLNWAWHQDMDCSKAGEETGKILVYKLINAGRWICGFERVDWEA